MLKRVFRDGCQGGGIPGSNHWNFGKKFIGTKFRWGLASESKAAFFLEIGECANGERPLDEIQNQQTYLKNLAGTIRNPFSGKEFRRVYAERNILPERDNPSIEVSGDGRGVTNIIQNFINNVHLQSNLVEIKLLNELNEVFKTDAKFTDIVCQKINPDEWEVFLEEEIKGRIPLSQSGSGLKTIILVLVYIHLVPVVHNKKLPEFVFAFEELENNLHPALLRRLLSYLYRQAKTEGCLLFLTTHSNIEIDFFNKNEDAQLIHVIHDGKQANCRTVQTYIDNKGILDDLDVRASDLLQSNGIIWVEGPSDRIYLNRWIDLWSEGKLKEGNHYQCVFYGGRLLAHISGTEPQLDDEGISILNVNKNAILVMDSDKKNYDAPLNSTKQRVIDEISKNDGIAWVTMGKEIENYIPSNALTLGLNIQVLNQVGQYDNFFEYLDEYLADGERGYEKRKPLLAEKVCPHMKQETLADILDLGERLEEICKAIRQWNSI